MYPYLLPLRPFPLSHHALTADCRLIYRVLAGWSQSVESDLQRRGMRRGYIGHLAVLAMALAELSGDRNPAPLTPEVCCCDCTVLEDCGSTHL